MLSLAIAFAATVNLTIPATPLPKALELLSSATGEHLACAKSLENEVLVLRLKDADESRVLKEIADCLTAKWETGTSGPLLIPDLAAIRKQKVAENAQSVARIAGALSKVNERINAQPRSLNRQDVAVIKKKGEADEKARAEAERLNKDYEGESFDSDLLPSWRALARILLYLGTPTLSGMQVGQRIVWAERPTPMQVAFPAALQGILANYRRESSLLNFPPGQTARIRLSVQREDASNFNVHLVALDESGKPRDLALEQLEPSSDELPKENPNEKNSTVPQAKLQIPSEIPQYLTLMTPGLNPVRDAVFEQFRPKLADPVEFEPLEIPSRLLLSYAEARNCNLVGTLAENSFAFMRPLAGKDNATISKRLSEWCKLKDGWLTAKPEVSPTRIPRGDAKNFLNGAVAKGGVSLDDATAWTLQHPASDIAINWFYDLISVRLTARGTSSTRATLRARDFIDLWTGLGDTAHRDLERGQTLPLDRLPQACRNLISRDVFWLTVLESSEAKADPIDEEDLSSLLYEADITDTLPNGIAGGTISLTIVPQPVVIAWRKALGEPVHRTPLTATNLGNTWATNERRGVDSGFDQFRVGTNRTYRLKIEFKSKRLSYEQTLSETIFPPNAPIVDHLPEDFRAKAEETKHLRLSEPDPTRLADPTKP